MNKFRWILFLLYLIVVFTLSCKSSEIPYTKKSGKAASQKISKKKTFIINGLNINALAFKTYSASCTLSYQFEEQKGKGKIYLRIEKGKKIWVSIRKINIEALRILITQDSIKVINRLNKSYFKKPFSFINDKFNLDVDYQTLESLLIGNPVDYIESSKKFVRNEAKTDEYMISTVRRRKYKKEQKKDKDKIKNPAQIIWVKRDLLKVSKLLLKNPQKEKLVTCSYSDFNSYGNQTYPAKINVEIPISTNQQKSFHLEIEKNKLSLETIIPNRSKRVINLTIKKLSLNKAIIFPFSIPNSYNEFK